MRNTPAKNGEAMLVCAALEATETAANAKQRAGELANVVRFAFVTGWRTTCSFDGHRHCSPSR